MTLQTIPTTPTTPPVGTTTRLATKQMSPSQRTVTLLNERARLLAELASLKLDG